MQEQINNSSMLKVGTILRGTYRIDGYLSSGGFGNTYVAINIEFEERIAIKEFFMRGVTQRDENQTTVSVSNVENHKDFLEQKEKFKKEARRLRKLKNDYIVSVHDLFEENGTAYYVMDYVDGENLAERLKRTGKPMTEEEVRGLLPQILDALKTVHNTGIWHLDLKPANIMLTKDGQVKLIDFGASKQLNAQKGGATTSTAISYTNGYAPREQMEQNYDKFGPWTDIYALGATIFTLLTNKRPPLPTNIDDDMSEDKHLALPLPDGISKDIKDLVLAMMHTNKNQRPQNVETIMAILSDSNQKDDVVLDTLSEETIIEPKRNGAKEEQKQDLFNNEETQIDTLNKGIEKKSETKKQIYIRLLVSIVIFSILGCVGWMLYNWGDQNTPETLERLYRNLTADGYKLGSYNDFKEAMSDSTRAANLYKNLSSDGYQLGSQEEFFEKVGNNSMSNSQHKTPKAEKPLQILHRTLLKYNWDVPKDYSSFEKTLTAKGKQGYRNRYTLWKELRDNNYDVPDNYDSFSRTLFVPKRTKQSATQTRSSIYKANKLNDLYDDLRAKGFAKDKTREEFFSYMLAPGKQGYKNRKAFFDDYKSHGLTDLNTYEEFVDWLGIRVKETQRTHWARHTFRTIETSPKPINTKIKKLYDVMKTDGDDIGTEQEFNKFFLARGKQGYKNRKAVYDLFKVNGADVGVNYEEFAKWLGLRPAKAVLKYQFFDKEGKAHTVDKSEYDAYSEDFAKQYPDVSMRMVAPDGKSRIVPIANVDADIKKDGYRMWLMKQ